MATKLDSGLVVHDGGLVKDVLDNAKPLANYTVLRAYTGAATGVRITAPGVAGFFQRFGTAGLVDNGGTVIIDAAGRAWERLDLRPAKLSWFADKNSPSDQTTKIQAWLDLAGSLHADGGLFLTRQLNLRSNTVITFDPSCEIRAVTGFSTNEVLLNLTGVSFLTIYGNNATVRMLKAEYASGEWRHCVAVAGGSSHITIYDLNAKDSGGDGFYVGGDAVNRNINLINCGADNNRRQGLSIVNAIGCNVIGGHYKNTIGTAPACGIDIESNLKDGYYLQDINVIGAMTSGNAGGGILVTPQSKFSPVSINVIECTSVEDGGLTASGGKGSISLTAAMAYTPATDPLFIGKISGSITIDDCKIINPKGSGFVSVNWTENAPYARVKNLYVLNPYSGGAAGPANRDKCGVMIRGETPSSGTYGTSFGNLEIEGLRVEDDRAVPLMYLPIYVEASDEAVKPLKDLSITGIDVKSGQWTYASGLVPFAKSGSLAQTNVVLEYKEFRVVNTAASITIGNNYVGLTMVNSGNINYSLPDASLFIGSTFHFSHTASGNFQITPATGDKILGYSSEAGGGLISRAAGSALSIKAISTDEWLVINDAGSWAIRTGYEPRYEMTFDTAAPTTGTWSRGDIIYNVAPSAGGFIGWVCTAAGAPGTWKTFGAISA